MGKTKILRHIVLMAVWAFATISLLPTTAIARTGGGMSVAPLVTLEYPERRSWFVYEAEPKTVIKDKVEILNLDDKTATINVAALDGGITNDGGYTLVGGVEQNKDVGTWVKLDKSVVTLPAKTKTTVGFTLTVPENADVGSHAGGIVVWAAKAPDAAGQQKGQLQVVTRVAARLFLTVPGDMICKLDISNVGHYIDQGVLYFKMTLRNDGNMTLLPEADIKLRGIFGRAGQQDRSQLGMLLRDTTINAKSPWQKRPPKIGRFVTDIRLHYGEKDFKNEFVKDEYQDVKYVFWLIPWIELLWIFVTLMLILFIRKFWVWILIRQRLNTKTKQHTVKKGETLSGIANLYNADAKKIARFNLLKWPYDLLAGDILLIPSGQMTKEEKAYQKAHPEPQARHLGLLASRQGTIMGQLQNLFRHHPQITSPSSSGLPARRSFSAVGTRGSRPGFPIESGMTKGVSGMTSNALEPVIVEAGDTLKTVAEFAGVTPKEIIALNKLNWPYKLRAGQELLIPAPSTTRDNIVSRATLLSPERSRGATLATKKSSSTSRLSAKKTVKRRPPKRPK